MYSVFSIKQKKRKYWDALDWTWVKPGQNKEAVEIRLDMGHKTETVPGKPGRLITLAYMHIMYLCQFCSLRHHDCSF